MKGRVTGLRWGHFNRDGNIDDATISNSKSVTEVVGIGEELYA